MATTADQSACKNACGSNYECLASHRGYLCTLNSGHSQPTHVACGGASNRHELATWED